ncbi:MAG: thioredoxin family protein [Alphaproteobacteria bacterium CG11_big_fil_rev_8_21_14_0_20_39_49]|nr:MAG: thioredoxin family protein [Alphaproteobacteria bacterium CG11_big_fil_rev_8_21_14_0_20_39_49]
MVALETPSIEENRTAADFELKGTDGKIYTLENTKGENGLLVMFICNHCPYVQAILDKIIRDCAELKEQGINSIAIMSNDTKNYPDDSFDNMKKLAQQKNFPFPYVIDETQAVAKQYGAVCTPDFFGFNRNLELQYRGRLDSSGMKNNPSADRDLFNAMMQVAQLDKGPRVQHPSIGCSIKWKE